MLVARVAYVGVGLDCRLVKRKRISFLPTTMIGVSSSSQDEILNETDREMVVGSSHEAWYCLVRGRRCEKYTQKIGALDKKGEKRGDRSSEVDFTSQSASEEFLGANNVDNHQNTPTQATMARDEGCGGLETGKLVCVCLF